MYTVPYKRPVAALMELLMKIAVAALMKLLKKKINPPNQVKGANHLFHHQQGNDGKQDIEDNVQGSMIKLTC